MIVLTDIENLKKMNRMIPELKKHGFAMTNDDAARQSADLYKNRYIEETKQNVAQNFDATKGSPDQVSFEHLDRIKQTVNTRLNSMEASISTVTAKINEIIKMINRLEQRQDSVPVKDEPTQRQTVIKTDKKEEKPSSPRSGDYQSKDVEIDKIFYFGNK